MKRGEVFFHPMEGSGQLSISWSSAQNKALASHFLSLDCSINGYVL